MTDNNSSVRSRLTSTRQVKLSGNLDAIYFQADNLTYHLPWLLSGIEQINRGCSRKAPPQPLNIFDMAVTLAPSHLYVESLRRQVS